MNLLEKEELTEEELKDFFHKKGRALGIDLYDITQNKYTIPTSKLFREKLISEIIKRIEFISNRLNIESKDIVLEKIEDLLYELKDLEKIEKDSIKEKEQKIQELISLSKEREEKKEIEAKKNKKNISNNNVEIYGL